MKPIETVADYRYVEPMVGTKPRCRSVHDNSRRRCMWRENHDPYRHWADKPAEYGYTTIFWNDEEAVHDG